MPQHALLAPERPTQDPSDSELSGLRLVPVPDVGPPFDGELPAGAPASLPAPAAQVVPSSDPSRARTYTAGARRFESPGPDGPAGPRGDGGRGAPHEGPRGDGGRGAPHEGEWPQQFARLLAEALAGARPIRQILPWTSERARLHLHNLAPLFGGGQRPRVLRVIATRPAREVIEMTAIVRIGARTHALAIRLEHTQPPRQLSRHDDGAGKPLRPAATTLRWVCTDIEAA
jgi:Family of unknown function (DUF6459)